MATTAWYIGSSSQRIILSESWEAYGISGMEDTIWSALNGWAVPHSELTGDQINVLETMRNEFLTYQEGPRLYPSPDRMTDFTESSYIYYARIMELYGTLVSTNGRGSKWFTGSGAPGTVVGAIPGDFYLNTANGMVYELS